MSHKTNVLIPKKARDCTKSKETENSQSQELEMMSHKQEEIHIDEDSRKQTFLSLAFS